MEGRQIPLTGNEEEKDEKRMREELPDDIRREAQNTAEMDSINKIQECSAGENREERIEGRTEKKKDRTLLELSIGIVVWGVLCQLSVVWFVSDKAGYSLGLWLGTFLAVAAGVHMWWALDRALDFERDTAVKMMTRHNIIRYVVIVVVMALIMISGVANPLAAFLGLMGLKVAAYLQPFTHKVLGYINN